jgi:hypothetical protein
LASRRGEGAGRARAASLRPLAWSPAEQPDDDARVKCRTMIEPIAERYRFDPASFDRVV